MSQTVKAAMLASRDLRGTDRLVVLAIAAHANTAGDAWPAVGTIAEYVGVSERTVQRSLARLVQAGRLVARKVAGIATRVYRLVVDGVTSALRGVTSAAAGVTDQPPGGDTHGASPEVEGVGRSQEAPARVGGRLDWRRYVPGRQSTTTHSRQRQSYPERRGAALPPANRAEQCPRHPGWLAHNCGGCRGEQLGGGAR